MKKNNIIKPEKSEKRNKTKRKMKMEEGKCQMVKLESVS